MPQVHWGKTRYFRLGPVSIGSEAYHMVSGYGSARGELNHTERSHLLLKTFILNSIFSIYTAWQNTSHQTQVVTDTSEVKQIQ